MILQYWIFSYMEYDTATHRSVNMDERAKCAYASSKSIMMCFITLLVIGKIFISTSQRSDWLMVKSNCTKYNCMPKALAPGWFKSPMGYIEDGPKNNTGNQDGRGQSPQTKRYITIKPRGRLGNNMFQYASLINIADTTNRTAVIGTTLMQLRRTFRIPLSVFPAHIITQWKMVTMDVQNRSDVTVTIERLRKMDGNIVLDCRCLSLRYFQSMAPSIRDNFKFRRSVIRSITAFWDKLGTVINSVTVGIHVRGTDYNTTERIQKGFGTPPASYIHNAMAFIRQMQANHGNVTFVVCSDDLKWAERNIHGRDIIFSRAHKPEEDLAILASCDYVIMSKGTFSFWAGWLSAGTVLYYDGDHVTFPRNHSSSLYVHQMTRDNTWIPIGG